MTERCDTDIGDARARDLLASIPSVLRARGYRLYLADGRRLVDLWQYGGAALLGHTAPGVLLALKNTASRGLSSPLPHPAARRFEKALMRLVPGRTAVRVYGDEASANSALCEAGFPELRMRDFFDPAVSDGPPDSPAAFLRPWCSASVDFSDTPILAPVVPLPWASRPIAFMLDAVNAPPFPPSDVVSPLVLATAARATDDLVAALAAPSVSRLRKTDAFLASAEGRALWTRRGTYLRPSGAYSAAAHALLFARFLEAGFLAPSDYRAPFILPCDASPGEDASLASLLSRALPSEIL